MMKHNALARRRAVDPQSQAMDLGVQIVSLLRESHASPLVWTAALDVARALLPVQPLREASAQCDDEDL